MKLKLFLLTTLSVIGLFLPNNILAETPTPSPLSVRLSQPKTPTNQNNLKLTFVALDIKSRGVVVNCYKKSPSEAVYSMFEEKILVPVSGDTGYCNVTSSILSNAGSYSFYVTAKAGGDSVTSSTVNVDFNTSGPNTPGSYSKERINNCDYKIKFKTADDSKTVKVELFRSDSLSISIDSGSRVSTQNIGPNTEGSFTNSIPTCGKEYFYALRAVDNADNVSGITGDNFTKVIIEGSTTTTSVETANTQTPTAIAIGSGSQITEETPIDNAGVTISPTSTIEPSPSVTVEPKVLGIQTSKWNNLKWLSVPLILIAAYFFLKSRKRA